MALALFSLGQQIELYMYQKKSCLPLRRTMESQGVCFAAWLDGPSARSRLPVRRPAIDHHLRSMKQIALMNVKKFRVLMDLPGKTDQTPPRPMSFGGKTACNDGKLLNMTIRPIKGQLRFRYSNFLHNNGRCAELHEVCMLERQEGLT